MQIEVAVVFKPCPPAAIRLWIYLIADTILGFVILSLALRIVRQSAVVQRGHLNLQHLNLRQQIGDDGFAAGGIFSQSADIGGNG